MNAGLSLLPARLNEVYAKVKARAPGATVAVTGYPRLFNGADCNPLTFFTATEMAQINAGTDALNAVIKGQAEDAGFTFVDAEPGLFGHATCDPQPWINNLSLPTGNSFHPNVAGHSAYAALTAPALFGTPVTLSATRPLAESKVQLPDVRSPGGPARLRLPDLSSPFVTQAAARAGVTTSELRRLRAAQRSGMNNTALDRLDARITAAAKRR